MKWCSIINRKMYHGLVCASALLALGPCEASHPPGPLRQAVLAKTVQTAFQGNMASSINVVMKVQRPETLGFLFSKSWEENDCNVHFLSSGDKYDLREILSVTGAGFSGLSES